MIARRIPTIPRLSLPHPDPRLGRAAALVAPLVFVNTLAAVGQVLWAQDNLIAGLPGEVAAVLPFLFAGAVESIALFLASQAHMARLAGDSAGYLSVAAYGWAGVAAWLQWSHWHTTSTTAGVVYAAMSALSPWLWGIWSRSIHRAQLRTLGLIEGRAVKFGRARWVLYPIRTLRVSRAAVWAAVVDPGEAIDRFDRPRLKSAQEPRATRSSRVRRWPWRSTDPIPADPIGSTQDQAVQPAPPLDPATAAGALPSPAVAGAKPDRSTRSKPDRSTKGGSTKRKSMDDVRLDLATALHDGRLTRPLEAAPLMRVLNIGPDRARALRDEDDPRQEVEGTDATDGDKRPEAVSG